MNRLLVQRSIDLLAPQTSDVVMDLFCGVGNFSLPLARQAGRVIGLELVRTHTHTHAHTHTTSGRRHSTHT